MKLAFITWISIFLFSTSGVDTKTDLLCQKWRQVGLKPFGKNYQAIDKSMAEIISFKKDGTFDQVLYGRLQFKGQWLFSNDSTKLAMEITQMNGKAVPGEKPSFDNKFANDSIIKLTRDTLIDGQLKFFGEQKIYGHDDVYYIREK